MRLLKRKETYEGCWALFFSLKAFLCGGSLLVFFHMSPCLSETYGFDDIPECHQLMLENRHPYGNMGVLVNAAREGLGVTACRQEEPAPYA